MLTWKPYLILLPALLAVAPAVAQQVDIRSGSVVETVKRLRPAEYVWAPQIAPDGPTLLIVNLRSQRAVIYRNGIPIGATSVSTGRPGYSTPTGIFTILQKHVEHYSSTYDNAPMPYMQRLTWRGIALHAGQLPGFPASHGCIRLPPGFAKLLYGATKVGMTVVITNSETTPRIAPTPETVLAGRDADRPFEGPVTWNPQASGTGPVSIIVSTADNRAVVLRNGIIIGSGPVAVDGPITGTWAYQYRSADGGGQHWTRLQLSSDGVAAGQVPSYEWQRFRAPDEFKRLVGSIIVPGTTIVVTSDSLRSGAVGEELTVMDADDEP